MSEDTLQHQINELNDRVADLTAKTENDRRLLVSLVEAVARQTKTIARQAGTLHTINGSVDALTARIAE